MNTTTLFKEIETLPIELQQQVADFVLFLKIRYREGADWNASFSEAELQELERRWEAYQAAPDEAMSTQVLKERLNSRYGI